MAKKKDTESNVPRETTAPTLRANEIPAEEPREVFAAKLEMMRIDPRVVTFRVVPDNNAELPFELPRQLQVPRNKLPKSDDFNLDFINSDLSKAEGISKKDKEKQAEWRALLDMRLVVTSR